MPVADRGVDTADQTLEQPVPRQQRRGQRQAEEQRPERRRRRSRAGPGSTPRPAADATVGARAVSATGSPVMFSVGTLTRTARAARPPTCCAGPPSETVNWPCTSTESLPWSTTPMRMAGSPRASHIARNRLSSVRGTATSTRPGGLGEQRDERVGILREARSGNRFHRPARPRRRPGSARPRTGRARPRPVRRATRRSAPRRATSRGPGRPAAARRRGGRRSTCAQIEPSNSSRVSPSRISVSPGSVPKAGRDAAAHVVDDAEHADHRGGQDRRGTGLVVEADVAAGDRNAQRRTAIRETADGLRELPHHAGVLGRAEVEAVGDRDRAWRR